MHSFSWVFYSVPLFFYPLFSLDPMTRSFYSLLFVSTLFFAGCMTVSPSKLGISQSDWDTYSDDKKSQLMASYEQTQTAKRRVRAEAGAGVLAVRIKAGTVLLPPYTTPTSYEPIRFTMREGDCHIKIPVTSVDSEKKGKLEACYKENTLYLDPSPYEPDLSLGSLQFPYMPVWKRGFTYPNVHSTGLLKLTNAEIFLHTLIPSSDEG